MAKQAFRTTVEYEASKALRFASPYNDRKTPSRAVHEERMGYMYVRTSKFQKIFRKPKIPTTLSSQCCFALELFFPFWPLCYFLFSIFKLNPTVSLQVTSSRYYYLSKL